MNVRQINDQLAGEQVIATDPTLAPAVDAGWRRRLNSYTGRSLSNIALMTEQNERSGRLATHGQVISPGVVSGLEVGVEGMSAPTVARVRLDGGPEGPPIEAPHASFFHVAAGTGLTVSGEDVVVPRPLRVNVQDVRVYAPVSVLDPGAAGSSNPAGTLAARRLDGPLRDVLARGVKLPSVAILVLQPIVAELLDVPSSTDPCAASPGDDAFNDWQLVDGCRLVLYFWPDEWLALPALDTRGRNRLAYTVFEAEARSSGLPSPWTAPDLPELPLPWLELGVPIALVSFDGAWAPRWVDRSSVVRQGGRLRGHRPWPANAGSPELWEARLQQFAEQMADPALAGAAGDALAQQFRYLPPVGLLPRDLIEFRTGQISFFPAYYATSARPVPLEQLDLVTEGAAALAPFDLFAAEAVEVLVPVPQVWYEPELLMTPQVDPAFLAAIADFSLQRFQWLQRRADVRAKASVIGQAVTGTAPQYPTPDPDQLDDESVPPATPYAGTQVHLSPAAAGYHAHAFSGATTTVAPTAADLLFGYVYPDPDNPPAAVMLTWSPNGEDWAHGAYWGTLPPSDGGPPFNARELGPLPPPGRWTRLEVPAALVNVAGSTLTGMAFAVVGGSAAWGRAGLATPQLGRAAAETTSIVDALPAGAAVVSPPGVTDEHWSWSDLTVQPFPLEDAFGTTIVNGAPVPAALADVRGKLPDYVQSDFDSYMNPQPANAGGLRGLVNDLQEKVRQSDDAIDFGFLRVQTDIYRVRQLMLGNVDATRLATSPALATIAQGQSAIATREDLQNYFKAAKGAIPTSTVSSVSAGSIASTVTGGTVESVPPSSVSPGGGDGVNPAELALSTDTGTATDRFPAGSLPFRTRAASRLVSASVPATVMMKPATLSESVMTPVTTDQTAIRVASVSVPQATVQMTPSAAVVAASVPITSMINLASTQTLPALHSHVAASSIDVVEQSPIVGAGYDFRSVTVAQRLEDPQAPEARSFTVASKYDVISSLHAIPINLDTVPIPGVATFKVGQDGGTPQPQYDNTGQPVRAPIQFKDLDGGGLTRVLNDPSPLNADEAGFFAAGILNLDHTIATLRGVEGRIQAYRSAIELCSQLLTTLEGFAGGTASRLTAIGNSLTETRHNISVARSLLADETARIDGIKQRRETVLAEHVPFLAFRRPRVSDVLRDSPARFLDPGLMQAPGPACLTQPVVVPPEIRAMVDLLHEAPVRWYPPILPLIDRFDRFDTLQDVLGNARNRAALQIPIRQAFLPSLAGQSQLGSAIAGVLTAQRQAVMQTRVALRQFDGAATGALSWRNLRDSARSLLSLGDLIDGGHGRSDVSQDAAAALDGVAHVAGCLYAHVGAVLPAIRLLWAERLSQYESSVNLRNLSSLPRWGELDGYSRQEMQGLVDWLYQQVDIFQADATSIMNDLVRVCILLASHAPVNEIIAGQVAQNTTVQPGGRVTLNIDPLRVRVGMQVLMYAESKVVAQGVVEDLSAGQVAARVVQAAAPTVQLTQGAAVHFAEPDAFARNLLTTGLSRLGSA